MYKYYEKRKQDDTNNCKYVQKEQQYQQQSFQQQREYQQPQKVYRNIQEREQRIQKQIQIQRKTQKQIEKQKQEQFIIFFQTISYEQQSTIIKELKNKNNLIDLFSNLRICANSYDSYYNLMIYLKETNQQQFQQQINVILNSSSFSTQIFERCTLLQLYQNSIENLNYELEDMYQLFSTLNLLDYHTLKQSCIVSIYNLLKVIELYNPTVFSKISSICNNFDQFLNKIYSSAQLLEWRQIPIYPVALEFFSNNHIHNQLFGKLEILSKENESMDRYIDYHFNLLREDYILEFKEAIIYLKENGFQNINKQITSQIKFYQEIELLQVEMNNCQIMWTIQVKQFKMDGRKLKQIYWEKSNELILGSLICLTNIVCYPLIFGVITKTDKVQSENQNGKIQLEFSFIDPNTSMIQFFNLFSQKTILMQFEGLIEPIHYYLQALKQKTSIPFSNIIIGNQKDVDYPYHLYQNHDFEIDLSNSVNYRGKILNILLPTWPQFNSTLDGSQIKAIKLMLQKEVALIYGPPGTGKTYCGALAVRLLYQNLQNKHFPILIVCYTNHALDQFLNHIIQFVPLQYVARLGGASKHPELQKCQIKCNEKVDFEFKIFNELKKDISKIIERMLKFNYVIRPKDIKKYWPDLYMNIIKTFFDDNCIVGVPFNLDYGEEDLVKYWIECNKPCINTIVNGQLNGMSSYYKMDKFYQTYEQFQHLIKNDSLQNQQLYSEDEDLNIYLDSEHELQSYNNIYKDIDFDIQAIDNAIKHFNENSQNIQLLHYDFQSIQKILNYLIYQNLNPWHLNPIDIEQILIYLENLRYQNDSVKFSRLYKQFIEQSNKLKELYDENEIKILNSMRIVGVTVTGVAKQAKKLQKLNSKIMIIEEAGEVLESHVASILTSNLQHLILIGDHQQQKPKLKNYSLQQKLKNVNVSLFERLFLNNIPSVTLNLQRRMKTKFSDFIRLIYSESYQDHPDIQKQNNIEIQGLEKDLVFFNHKWLEAQDEQSKENKQEAQMIFEMVLYLLKCGYQQNQISVLTLYLKQAQVLKRQFQKSGQNNIIVQTVENYQGEENDIIIISLVRNNKNNILGLIKIENQINVALSRARLGLYVFGNLDFIYNASSSKSLWQQIIQLAKNKNCLNDYINTKCVPHGNLQKIQQPEDWKKIKPLLCNKKCLKIFSNCTHLCSQDCHISDNHPAELCPFQCDRIMKCGHKCKLSCKEKCKCTEIIDLNLPCNHKIQTICGTNPLEQKCLKQVQIQFPKCLHITQFICYQREDYIHKCQQQCKKILICGHTCNKICYIDCGFCMQQCQKKRSCGHNSKCKNKCFQECSPCDTPVQTELVCGHTTQFSCFSQKKDLLKHLCEQNCIKKRECGHNQQICENKCYKQCSPCNETINHTFQCGHNHNFLCHSFNIQLQQFICNEPCLLKRQCGHNFPCLSLCNQNKCSPCLQIVNKKLDCGHIIQIKCCEYQQKQICKEPCNKIRECGHIYLCKKLCIEQCQPCEQIVLKTLPCDHQHLVNCNQYSKPIICKENCIKIRQCGHNYPCTNLCNENCTPCKSIILQKLKCGHNIDIECNQSKLFQSNYKCNQQCIKIRPCGHDFPCYNICSTKNECTPCQAKTFKTLDCGHQLQIKCFQMMQKFNKQCENSCNKQRPCGHNVSCSNKCYEPCSPCTQKYEIVLKCGHKGFIKCFQKDDQNILSNVICQYPCNKKRDCGHNSICTKKCSQKCDPCSIKVQIPLNCGHFYNALCQQDPKTIICNELCQIQQNCGHLCKQLCGRPCLRCEEIIIIKFPKCIHQREIKCYENNQQLFCDQLIKVNYSCQQHQTQIQCCEQNKTDLKCPQCYECIIF